MSIKLEEKELDKLKQMLVAKAEIYNQFKEMQHYAENFAIGIWQEQKKLEEKYKVDLASGKDKLNLQTNEIEQESKIIA